MIQTLDRRKSCGEEYLEAEFVDRQSVTQAALASACFYLWEERREVVEKAKTH